MGQIQVLSQETINQIAAGEVIERPASVVKELVENAIDAGATAISVELKEGGLSLIRITDNGSGISAEDVPLAFLPHATSKIRSALDLLQVSSLGFRGEALASIAAVSQVELITKTKDDLCATRYCIEGGKEVRITEIGAPQGTTFFVRNLFFNTPARRKFLKSAAAEGALISDLLTNIALSHPEISFQLIHNNKNHLYTTGNGKLLDTCYSVFGRDEIKTFLEVSGQEGDFSFRGYIADSTNTRGNRNYEYYFINGRYIKSNLISKAIEDGYAGYLMQHRYPFTVLHFEIPPSYMDVNVHPTKMEIRFQEEARLYHLIASNLSRRLRKEEIIPDVAGKSGTVSNKANVGAATVAPEPFLKERERVNAIHASQIVKETAGSYKTSGLNFQAAPPIPKVQMPVKPQESITASDLHKETDAAVIESKISETEPLSGAVSSTTSAAPKKETAPLETLHSEANQTKESETNTVTLSSKTGIPKQDTVNPPETTQTSPVTHSRQSTVSQNSTTDETPSALPDLDTPQVQQAEQITLFEERFLSKEAKVKHRLIGQVFDTYWLVQYEDKLYIMDQHAAHEKVLYEKNVKAFREKQTESQLVSPPILLTLRSQEILALQENMELFESLGYEIESFGSNTYALRAVPSNLYHLNQKAIFMDLLDDLCANAVGSVNHVSQRSASEEKKIAKISLPVLMDKLATMSCKAAVKGNMHLSFQEADALVTQLLTLDNPYACPHGRPTFISMTKNELEHRFSRKL